MIIVEPCAGLGNRFLGMASAYHWAKQTGDELTVLWKTERVMGARNEAVFSLPEEIKIIHAKDFGYKGNWSYRLNATEKTSARFNRSQLESCLRILQQLDTDLKSSKLDADLLMQKALCELALAGRA